MAKPIFIIRVPGYWTTNQVNESRKAIHGMTDLNEDYHIIILQDNEEENRIKELENE